MLVADAPCHRIGLAWWSTDHQVNASALRDQSVEPGVAWEVADGGAGEERGQLLDVRTYHTPLRVVIPPFGFEAVSEGSASRILPLDVCDSTEAASCFESVAEAATSGEQVYVSDTVI
jgi:hypothetical protein